MKGSGRYGPECEELLRVHAAAGVMVCIVGGSRGADLARGDVG